MDDQAAPYPPAPKGTKYRVLPFPVGNPDRTPREPVMAKRRDGSECDVMATLGARPGGPVAPDEQVHDWTPWP